jgi:hypothetical protein
MLFSFLMVAGLVISIVSAIAVPLLVRSGSSNSLRSLAATKAALLLIAGILSGLMMLISISAAAWGMDTRLPWGLGVYMYLIPALSLPAFLLLKFSIHALSRTLWLLAVISGPAFFLGDRADRIATGLRPLTGPREIIGTFLNAFTLLYLAISVLVQMAALCDRNHRSE